MLAAIVSGVNLPLLAFSFVGGLLIWFFVMAWALFGEDHKIPREFRGLVRHPAFNPNTYPSPEESSAISAAVEAAEEKAVREAEKLNVQGGTKVTSRDCWRPARHRGMKIVHAWSAKAKKPTSSEVVAEEKQAAPKTGGSKVVRVARLETSGDGTVVSSAGANDTVVINAPVVAKTAETAQVTSQTTADDDVIIGGKAAK